MPDWTRPNPANEYRRSRPIAWVGKGLGWSRADGMPAGDARLCEPALPRRNPRDDWRRRAGEWRQSVSIRGSTTSDGVQADNGCSMESEMTEKPAVRISYEDQGHKGRFVARIDGVE